jgi:hypothetical protein
VARVEFHVDFVLLETISYSQSFESAPKNVTRRLRGGYASRKHR